MKQAAFAEDDAGSPGSHAAYDMQGLSYAKVQERRARGLGNTAPHATGRTYAEIISENVFTFINFKLFGLGAVLILLGRVSDGLVSTGVIALNGLVSVVQEVRAKRLLDRVALLNRPKATVVREGHECQVQPEELVMGDLLVVGAGDQIVVDGRVIDESRLDVDESLLSGESDLVHKHSGDVVYSGSFCASGGAHYVAERVGVASLSNTITAGARAFRRVLTPLQRGIYLVIRMVLLIVGYVQFVLLLRAVISSTDLASSVQNATIVAGLVPNGLFLSISIAYAVAAVRILRKGVLVRQSNAIESLSNVDTLCLDKAGTLTANRLRVEQLCPVSHDLSAAEFRHVLGVVVASATFSKQDDAGHRRRIPIRVTAHRRGGAVLVGAQVERGGIR